MPFLLLLACTPRTPPPSPGAEGDAAEVDTLARVAGSWRRTAWLEGRWQTPPEQGSLAPIEVSSRDQVVIVRSGTGERRLTVRGASALDGGVRLQVEGGVVDFLPWSRGGESIPEDPPEGAWIIVLPGASANPAVAWHRS